MGPLPPGVFGTIACTPRPPEWPCYSGVEQMVAGTRRPRRRTAKEHGPDPIDVQVGRQVRVARTLAGLTQSEFGRRLDMSFQLVQKYEQGEIRIAASRLYRIAQLLERPAAFFFADAAMAERDTAATVPAREEIALIQAYRRIARRDLKDRIAALVKEMAGRPAVRTRGAKGSAGK
jgi:transcriptional regulator with XRE-family HTH domain